jgi:hypothetical protein
MSAEAALRQRAIQEVNKLKEIEAHAEKDLRKLEEQRASLISQRDAARLGQKRLLNYRPRLGPDLQCPGCWIRHEVGSALMPMSGTHTEEFLECKVCGVHIVLPPNG